MEVEEHRIDPRIIRTRRLIMDAFIKLSSERNVKDITIKDITREATVNRATFYYHFTDKYDLLTKTLQEDLLNGVLQEIKIKSGEKIDENMIKNVFISIIDFQQSLATQCQKSFESFTPTIEMVIKRELTLIFKEMLIKKGQIECEETARIASVTLSWAIYGATLDYQENSFLTPEQYIDKAIPFIKNGVSNLNLKK